MDEWIPFCEPKFVLQVKFEPTLNNDVVIKMYSSVPLLDKKTANYWQFFDLSEMIPRQFLLNLLMVTRKLGFKFQFFFFFSL